MRGNYDTPPPHEAALRQRLRNIAIDGRQRTPAGPDDRQPGYSAAPAEHVMRPYSVKLSHGD